MEHTMADMTTGTGADSPEDIRDEPALESVGVDPDAPIAQADANEPGQNDEEDDEFDDDDDDADDSEADEEDDKDEDAQQASDTETE
jgi:C-terminal processing protease CtpA/Prc